MENNHDDEEVIRQKMQEARNSLTDKLEVLEESVVGTVSETADVVKETVETVKDTVEATAETVKETVQEGVDTVRHWLDFSGHTRQHPWLMMAGAAGFGFILETILVGRRPSTIGAVADVAATVARPVAAASQHHHRSHHNGNGHSKKRGVTSAITSTMSGLFGNFGPQVAKLKDMAINSLLQMVKQTVLKSIPQQMHQTVTEMIDTASRKLVGEPATDSGNTASGATQQGESNEYDPQRIPSEMGRPMGPTRR
jgi:ElaB/YqjD/DUF883 family membrane-anchored ribosome-binding protein